MTNVFTRCGICSRLPTLVTNRFVVGLRVVLYRFFGLHFAFATWRVTSECWRSRRCAVRGIVSLGGRVNVILVRSRFNGFPLRHLCFLRNFQVTTFRFRWFAPRPTTRALWAPFGVVSASPVWFCVQARVGRERFKGVVFSVGPRQPSRRQVDCLEVRARGDSGVRR